MVDDAVPTGVSESAFAGGADAGAAAVVFVGWGDVADRGVQAHRVVLLADVGVLGPEDLRVADAVQVRPVGFGVGFTLHHVARRLPAVVRVVGGDHPLSGRALRARRVYRRFGRLWLVVELPDGGETSVRLEGTDLFDVELVVGESDGTTTLSCEGARRLLELLAACMARSAIDAVAEPARERRA